MTTLIVTLPPAPFDAATLYDHVLTVDGSTVDEHSRAPVALLPTVDDRGGEVVALVSARNLSWHPVQLPRGTLGRRFFQEGGASRLRAVLEGLLEERLLDDTSQLHFAIEPQPRADAPVWVAVCDRAWLRGALQALEQAGRTVARIVPEFAPDSLTDAVYVMGEPDDAQMVFTARGGVAVWPLSAASVALLNWPDTAGIVAEPAVAALAEQLFQRNVTLQQSAQRRLLAIQSPWNLAQFDLLSSSRTRTWKRLSAGLGSLVRAPRWRAARVALLALLAVNLVGLNAWARKEEARINAKRVAIREVLTSTFPNVRVVVDAPLQMAREVAALQRASGVATGRDMETMLGMFGALAFANKAPDAIEFVAGEVRMKGLKLPAADMSQLAFKLQAQGYAATAEGDNVIIKQVSAP
ncbi:MAG: type II secretion system protein GspL [Rhodoferax sp.]|uniref:type II secretion system protein GspL n=1 Tax=Rhodoferax sp. TaxID=50421 RepID=UPI0027167066|nr:type II secretion system protein GspL [Rhodoferax sp.]MDO8449326.1 type II secretion system protein GspL [Rhodoferax sp.]